MPIIRETHHISIVVQSCSVVVESSKTFFYRYQAPCHLLQQLWHTTLVVVVHVVVSVVGDSGHLIGNLRQEQHYCFALRSITTLIYKNTYYT